MDNNQEKKPYKDELSEILARRSGEKQNQNENNANQDDVRTYYPEKKSNETEGQNSKHDIEDIAETEPAPAF